MNSSEILYAVIHQGRYGVIMPAHHEETTKYLYACMTRSSTKELLTPFKNPEREFCSSRKLFKTPSLEESSSPEFDLFSDLEDHFEEEVAGIMAETMEEYMCKTCDDCYDEEMGSYRLKDFNAYSIGTTLHNDALPQKEKDPGSFTLPCYLNNVYFEKALDDLGASDYTQESGSIEKVFRLRRMRRHLGPSSHQILLRSLNQLAMCVLPLEGLYIGRQLFLKMNMQKELMEQVFIDMPYQPPMKNKQVIETILDVTQCEDIAIGIQISVVIKGVE
ncbi:hypothetical protein Tco_0347828 [Tanacetum coccineum]